MQIIYDNIYKGEVIRLAEVTDFLNANPEYKKINSDVEQKKVKGKIY